MAAVVMIVAAAQIGDDPASGAPSASDAVDGGTPDPADAAAGFTVPLRGGGDFDLARHLAEDGRPLLLNLWASWCIPCRNEMPLLDQVAAERPEIVILGVAVNDAREQAEGFADEIGITYPIAFDIDGAVAAEYPAPAMPVTYLISPAGTVVGRYFGELDREQIDELLTGLG